MISADLGDLRLLDVEAEAPARTFPYEYPKQLDLGNRLRLTQLPYQYLWHQEGEFWKMRVPAGFLHDGASIPQVVRSFYPPYKLDASAVGHDYPYHYAGKMPTGTMMVNVDGIWHPIEDNLGRQFYDRAFRIWLDMDPGGPGRFRRRAAYYAVRSWGWRHWGARRDKT